MYWILKLNVELTELPATKMAEKLLAVTAGGDLLFTIGFDRLSLLSDFVYITMEPYDGLRAAGPSTIKSLKKLFDEYPGYIYYRQIEADNERALRWAEFFGFKRAGELAFGRIQLEKDTR